MAVSLWLIATFTLAVALPVNWAQHTLINVDGYTAMARVASHKPGVQNATAALLTEQVSGVARNNGINVGTCYAMFTRAGGESLTLPE